MFHHNQLFRLILGPKRIYPNIRPQMLADLESMYHLPLSPLSPSEVSRAPTQIKVDTNRLEEIPSKSSRRTFWWLTSLGILLSFLLAAAVIVPFLIVFEFVKYNDNHIDDCYKNNSDDNDDPSPLGSSSVWNDKSWITQQLVRTLSDLSTIETRIALVRNPIQSE